MSKSRVRRNRARVQTETEEDFVEAGPAVAPVIHSSSTRIERTTSNEEVDESLQSMTRRVSVDDLVREGRTKNLKMISEKQLKNWILEALSRIIESTHTHLSDDDRAALLAGTHTEFKSVMAQHKREQKELVQAEETIAALQAELRQQQAAAASSYSAQDIEAYKTELAELHKLLAAAQEGKDSAALEITQLHKTIAAQESCISTAEKHTERLEKKAVQDKSYQALLDRCLKLDEKLFAGLHVRQAPSEDAIGVAEATLDDIEEGLDAMNESLLSIPVVHIANFDTNRLETDISRIEVLLSAREQARKYTQAEKELSQLTAQCDALSKNDSEQKQVIADLRITLDSVRIEKKAALKDGENQLEQVHAAQQQMERLRLERAEKEAELVSLKKRAIVERQQFHVQEKERLEQRASCAILMKNCVQHEQTIAQLYLTINELEHQHHCAVASIEGQRQEREHYKRCVDDVCRELAQKEEAFKLLELELEEAKEQSQQLKEIYGERDALNKVCSAHEQTIADLRVTLGEYEDSSKLQSESAQKQTTDMQADRKALEEDIKKLQLAQNKLMNECERYKCRIDDLCCEQAQKQESFKTVAAELQDVQNQRAHIHSERDAYMKTCETHEQTITDLRLTLKESQQKGTDQLQSVQKQNEDVQGAHQALAEEIVSLRLVHEKRENDYATLEKKHTEQKTLAQQYKEELASEKEQTPSLEGNAWLDELVGLNKEKDEQIKSLKKDVRKRSKQQTELRKKVTACTEQITTHEETEKVLQERVSELERALAAGEAESTVPVDVTEAHGCDDVRSVPAQCYLDTGIRSVCESGVIFCGEEELQKMPPLVAETSCSYRDQILSVRDGVAVLTCTATQKERSFTAPEGAITCVSACADTVHGHDYLFYRVEENLAQFHLAGEEVEQTHIGTIASTSAINAWFWAAESSLHFVLRDQAGHVIEYLNYDGTWRAANLTAQTQAPLAASTPIGYAPQQIEHVIYTDESGLPHELWFDQSWHHSDLHALCHAPAVHGHLNGGYINEQHVICYRDQNGQLILLHNRETWICRNVSNECGLASLEEDPQLILGCKDIRLLVRAEQKYQLLCITDDGVSREPWHYAV